MADASEGSEPDEGAGALVLLCGRSFSGKSTVARWLQEPLAAEVVSLDAINAERGLAGGRGILVAEWARTNEEAKLRTTSVLRAGGTIIVDDTASPRFLRDGWREVARGAGARFILVFLDTDPETLRARWARNRDREERPDVTDAVMAGHLASFEPPEADEVAVSVPADAASAEQLVAVVRHQLTS